MCGLVCYFADKPYKENIFNALNKLNHRGPDFAAAQFLEKGKIGIGHTRLSIVDLFGGQQPISNEEGSIFVVVNGEFYDYQKIRSDFAAKGYKFKTNSDSEIIIPLYLEYGLNLFEYLTGEFAFILYDSHKKRVIAARDRFGIKPLYYHLNKSGLFLGSEIKALLPFDIKAQWNSDAVLLGDSFIPSQQQTYFKGIDSIKPGHYITFENDKVTEKCYWDLSFSESTENIDYLVESFKALLVDSVKKRLHGDVPIAFYISGGLDSSAILSLATQKLEYKGTAFNISFDKEEYDESTLSKAVAQYLNIEYVPVNITSDSICNNFRKSIYHNEAIVHNTNGVAKYLLSEAVHNAGFKVVLTGEGADEVLAGYPFFREDMIRHNGSEYQHSSGLLKELASSNKYAPHLFLSGEKTTRRLEEVQSILGYIPSMWRVGAYYGEGFQELIYNDDYKHEIKKRNVFLELIQSLNTMQIKSNINHPVNCSLYLWSKTSLPSVILSFLGDRMEMAHSVEGRLPFLDHRLVEFCQRLPVGLKIRNLQEKFILREALKDIIHPMIYQRQKFPFIAPPLLRFNHKKSNLETMILDILHSQSMKKLPFYDQSKILQYVKQLENKSEDERRKAEPILNRVISAVILAEEFSIES